MTKASAGETVKPDSVTDTQSPDSAVAADGKGFHFGPAVASYGVWATFLAAFVIFSAAKPDVFLTWANFSGILNTAVVASVMALAVTIPLIMNDFDLSVGPVASFANVLVVILMVEQHVPVALAILLTLGCGVIVGLVNGFLVAKLGGQAFIITLGVGSAVTGFAFLLSNQETILNGLPASFVSLGSTQIEKIVLPVFITLGLVVILWLVTTQTPIGRYFYGIGSNIDAARLVGLPVTWLRIVGFVFSGVLASMAGVYIAALSASTYPNAGEEYLLPAFASAFLGSALLASRRFSVIGSAASAVLLQMVATGLVVLSLDTWVINLFNGVVLVTAILTSLRVRKR